MGAEDGRKTVCGGLTSPGDVGLEGGNSVIGIGEGRLGLVRPERGSRGVPGVEETLVELWYSIMLKMFSGRLLDVMMVVTPAAVAISAAMIFVSIPPVPRLDPRVVVLTVT